MIQLNLILPPEYMSAGVAVFFNYLRDNPNAEIDSDVTIPFQGQSFVVTRNAKSYTVTLRLV